MGKKFLLRIVIWLRTREGRRNEGREQMGLEDTLDEKTFKGEEWYDVSGSERWTRLASRLQKALLPNKLGQFWGEIQSKLSVATLPPFFHITNTKTFFLRLFFSKPKLRLKNVYSWDRYWIPVYTGQDRYLIFFGQVGYQDYVRPWEIFFCV